MAGHIVRKPGNRKLWSEADADEKVGLVLIELQEAAGGAGDIEVVYSPTGVADLGGDFDQQSIDLKASAERDADVVAMGDVVKGVSAVAAEAAEGLLDAGANRPSPFE